jgi:thioredoxin reductase (NADPH)
LKFGADFHVPSTVSNLERRSNGLYRVRTIEGDYVLGKSVIIAAGISYGLLDVKGLDKLRGSGVYYNATNVESRLCRSSAVHLVGGGNSAGQAAMFLSQSADEVSLLVRGPDLRKMSSYLSERVLANRRIRIRYNTEVIMDLKIQTSRRAEACEQRGSRPDLSNGCRESDLGSAAHSRRTA